MMSLQLNGYQSEKIKALSFGAIILVVFIHSHNQELKLASGDIAVSQGVWLLFIENFISKGICRIAIPIFFTISGYLFFQKYEFTIKCFIDKLKKRFYSLVVPYFFWSGFGLIFILLLQSIPWSRNFFTKELIIYYSFSKLLFTLLVDPIPYQLWFIRDLVMLVLFSPLIWYLTKSIHGVWIAILILLWTMAPKTFELFSNEALLFFTLGCALTLKKRELLNRQLSKAICYYFFIAWMVISLATASLITLYQPSLALNILDHLCVLTGLLTVWSAYDHVDHKYIAKFSYAFGYTFIIFVFHEPILTIFKKGMFFLLGSTNFASLFIYFIAPLMAICCSVFVGYVLKRQTPGFYNAVTGGR